MERILLDSNIMNKNAWASQETRKYYEEQEESRIAAEKVKNMRHYWYSPKMANVLAEHSDRFKTRHVINYVWIEGNWKEFTAQTPDDNHRTLWDDIRIVAIGDNLATKNNQGFK